MELLSYFVLEEMKYPEEKAHTNFKITQTKGNEVIMISDPSQVLLDSVTVRPNIKTHSRGRETDGSVTWSVFLSLQLLMFQIHSFFRI